MGHKGELKTADEYDALTRWRKYLSWRAGERAAIKAGYNRRQRRIAKSMLQVEDKT